MARLRAVALGRCRSVCLTMCLFAATSGAALAQTPRLVKDIHAGPTPFLSLSELEAVGGLTFFQATDPQHGEELWKSDGTAAGTVMVKDISPGSSGSFPGFLTDVDGTLFFIVFIEATHRFELWKSDGTTAGTVLVYAFDSDFGGLAAPFTNVNGILFFQRGDAATGWEIWKSDGTAAGTSILKDIWPGPGPGYGSYSWITDARGILFFVADDGETGSELWKSDGTAAGTVLVKDLNPGFFPSDPS